MEQDESTDGGTAVIPSLPESIIGIPIPWNVNTLPEPYNNPESWKYQTHQTRLPEPEAWKTLIIQRHKELSQKMVHELCHQYTSLTGPLTVEGRVTEEFHQYMEMKMMNSDREGEYPTRTGNNFHSTCGTNTEMKVVSTGFTVITSSAPVATYLQKAYQHPLPAIRQLSKAAARLNTGLPINAFGMWYIYTKANEDRNWQTWHQVIAQMWETMINLTKDIQKPHERQDHTEANTQQWIKDITKEEIETQGLGAAIMQKMDEGGHPSAKVWTHWEQEETGDSTWRTMQWRGGSTIVLSAPKQKDVRIQEEPSANHKITDAMETTMAQLTTMAEQIRTHAEPRPKRRRTLRDRGPGDTVQLYTTPPERIDEVAREVLWAAKAREFVTRIEETRQAYTQQDQCEPNKTHEAWVALTEEIEEATDQA
eukprot:gene6679-4808_t